MPSSIDQPRGDDEGISLPDLVSAESQYGPEACLNDALLAQATRAVLGELLSERERRVIEMRFGVGGGHTYPLDDIADRLGLTREHVGHIERGALAKLRASAKSTHLLHLLAA